MSSVRVLHSDSHDPWFNLAVEDTIFRAMPATQRILFLWRNADTVVIGRGQNPWTECNTRRMEQDGIKLARRQTGGGAVFHDLGNTNFTFMGGKPEFDKSISTQIVLDALTSVGIRGKLTGRNDLVIETEEGEKKFSGSAYRDAQDRGFHHGTLLLHANLARLADYLNPDIRKLQAKGVASVRSRVINLQEIDADLDHDRVSAAIEHSFLNHYNEYVEREHISPEAFSNLPGFVERFQKQSDWNWNFGKALQFSHSMQDRFAWGGIDCHLDVHRGLITQAKFFTDSLYPEALERLADQLIGNPYTAMTIDTGIAAVSAEQPERAAELSELQRWLRREIA